MTQRIELHYVESRDLIQGLGRWLLHLQELPEFPGKDKLKLEYQTLLDALRADKGMITTQQRDLLLDVISREIGQLQLRLENPEGWLPPFLPPSPKGLFKAFQIKKAYEAHERAREEALARVRKELTWLQFLRVKLPKLQPTNEGEIPQGALQIFTPEEVARDYGGDQSKAYYDQGTRFLDLGENRLAEANFRAAIAANPSLVWAYGNLAIALDNQGRYSEALDSIEKALSFAPDDADFRRWRAEIVAHDKALKI